MTVSHVPHSNTTQRPVPPLPPRACDAHLHILDSRFPAANPDAVTPEGMTWADYGHVQRHLGCQRAVIVQAKHYGFDNRCLLDALARSQGQARGVAVVASDVSEAALEQLHHGGVRGVRFSVWNSHDAIATWDTLAPLAERIARLGWHVQLHATADQLVTHAALIEGLPTPVVIDHMGRLPPDQGLAHHAAQLLRRWLARGTTWIKLSGAYLNSTHGGPDYPPTVLTAQQLVHWAPERLFWGSDWPHVTEHHKPDDAHLANLLSVWAGDHWQAILVDNPGRFYGFDD
ncbi:MULTISPECIES: amidohydrolase family protein [Pseudomonas]|uniref:Amidohydrolase family protein n=1 Tax=Pseudomonas quercus TaxID=2722792 RepID=A0ABX0YGR6_9PSED|nr:MULTISPECIES: amidohydrolase family protein [Pseudomonas]MBF7142655.1 amidohydrolase family protein [Pseudomonas sp. LY10J]NJP01193.1 amidohydrolase family protein [Pseudomonas quercus]